MCSALASIPMSLTPESLAALLSLVECLYICAGHPENRFVQIVTARNGILKTKDGQTASFVDDYASVSLNGEIFSQTVRTAEYELLVHNVKCKCCKSYRGSGLHSGIQFRWGKIKQMVYEVGRSVGLERFWCISIHT